MNTKYHHVLFDLDGTIYNTEYAFTKALLDVIKKNKPDTDENYESLLRFMGASSGEITKMLQKLDLELDKIQLDWVKKIKKYLATVKAFDGMISLIKHLNEKGIKLGIITSRNYAMEKMLGNLLSPFPNELKDYFDICICNDDVQNPKPAPDSILKYMEMTGAKKEDILFIGDTQSDINCAKSAGVDFALAIWGSHIRKTVKDIAYLSNPWDILGLVFYEDHLNYNWYKWAKEIQAIGQIGLYYSKDIFDIERFERCRELACEMLHSITEEPVTKIKESICFERGFATPKLDTRAAIFNKHGQILLVYETLSGLWSLPGGWCDENQDIKHNIIKESFEEAGMNVVPYKFVGLLNKNRRNPNNYPFNVLSAFMLCYEGDGEFEVNSETKARCFFSKDQIPYDKLRLETTSIEELEMCFAAYEQEHWVPIVD